MKWAAALREGSSGTEALDAALRDVEQQLGEAEPHLAFVFLSGAYRSLFERVGRIARERLAGARIVGCSAGGIIGAGREVERGGALSILAGHLPGVAVRTAHGEDAEEFTANLAVDADLAPAVLMALDPFSVQAADAVTVLDRKLPRGSRAGGVASGGASPGSCALLLDEQLHTSGMVGVALYGDVVVDTLVAQGARPVGPVLCVTKALKNVAIELDGRPASEVLQEVFAGLSPSDRTRLRRNPMIGLAANDRLEAQDWLVRDILGVHGETGGLAAAWPMRVDQLVRLHVRDAGAASDELKELLLRYKRGLGEPPQGAVLFSCVGRGQGFYKIGGHDSRMVREILGPIPLGGFFGNGELGTVRGSTQVHGYTTSFAFFRPAGFS
jgi:small ligand-binding sensory domain FIST